MTVTTIWLLSSEIPKKPVCPVFSMALQSFRKAGESRRKPYTLENTVFYQLMPENSDRRHCSCQALSLCKKARRKLMHLSLRLAFARTDCTPMTHCVPMGRNSWNFQAFRSGIFFGAAWWWTWRDSNSRPLGCEPNALPNGSDICTQNSWKNVEKTRILRKLSVMSFSYKTLFRLPRSKEKCLLYYGHNFEDATQTPGKLDTS